MDFDKIIDQRGAFNSRWAKMEAINGINPDEGLGMSVADSDFQTAPCVIAAMQAMVDHGAFPYGWDDEGYRAAVTWWQGQRHGWQIEPDWITTVQGLGQGIALCIDIWSEPGDGICYFTPVYHEFRYKTENAGRRPVEFPMKLVDGRYELDFDVAEAAISPDVKILIFCAPQNPSGRVWTRDEMRAVAEFAARHDLLLVSDEIHADLVYAPHKHIPMDVAAPEHRARTVTVSAASKTFNLAGLRVGQAIIPDPELRAAYQRRLRALDYSPGTTGMVATKAAFTPAGEEWRQELLDYLTENRSVFDAGINAIPGLWSMPLESTFLAWVDFSGTGMEPDEIAARIRDDAKIGVSPGRAFGTGGELFNRFNLSMPRSRIEDAVARMQHAFGDLQ